jgi:hypothetical protein
VNFAGEHQKGFAVDNELQGNSTSFQVRQVWVLRADRDRGDQKRRNGYCHGRQPSDSHSGCHSAKSQQDLST